MFHGNRLNNLSLAGHGVAPVIEQISSVPLLAGDLARVAIERAESPRQLSYQEILAGMAANVQIPLANGYVLVPDYRPVGEEDEYIPGDVFTWYFANGMAPYASSGKHRRHDMHHGPSYYQLFQSPSLAACIKESAGVSYANGGIFNFTTAMDRLGDSHVLLTTCEKPDVEKDFGHIQDAKLQLQRLIQLREGESAFATPQLTWRQNQLFGRIWYESDFAQLEDTVDSQLAELPAEEQAEIVRFYARSQ